MNCKGTAINLCVDGGTGFSLILSQCLVFGQVKRLWENFLLFFTKTIVIWKKMGYTLHTRLNRMCLPLVKQETIEL